MSLKAISKGKKTALKSKKDTSFPLEKENFYIISAGIILIILGYVLMSRNSVDGFLPSVLSPILLVFGYCFVIPYGILRKSKEKIIQKEISSPDIPENK
jgi:hypothetical protein